MSSSSTRWTHDLFVSYAHKDDRGGFVSAFVEALKAEHARFSPEPLDVFFDVEGIRDGSDWEHRILGALRGSKLMLAVLSPRYFESDYCRKEWERYLEHEQERALVNEAVFPIYTITVPGFEDEAEAALDDWLRDMRRRQYVDARPWHEEGVAALRREDVRARLERLDQEIAAKLVQVDRGSRSTSTIPPHNPNFTGRVEELRQLRETLSLGRVGAITAVHGIGGMGKSALAFEYAHLYESDYPGGRFLLSMEGDSDLTRALARLVDPLGITLTDDEKKSTEAIVARVRRALESRERSLLLLDNVETLQALAPATRSRLLPGGDRVHVLVTSRSEPDKALRLETIALDRLPEADAVRLLEKYRRFVDEADREAALGIARRLDGFPLALEVVAVFLWQTPEISYADYLARLEAEGLEALGEGVADEVLLSRHNVTLLTELLAPTLDRLPPEETLAVELAALLPPDQVPLPWLRHLVGEAFPALAGERRPGYPDPWQRVVRRLFGLRLLTTGDVDPVSRMHRLVQEVVRVRLGADRQSELTDQLQNHAMNCSKTLRTTWLDYATRWETDPLAVFAEALMSAESNDRHLPGAELANGIALTLNDLGLYIDAERLIDRSLSLRERHLGSDHPDVATSLNNLAELYRSQGRYADAEPLYQRSLSLLERVLGSDHPAVARSLNNLAILKWHMQDPVVARNLMQRALEIWTARLGTNHPHTQSARQSLSVMNEKG